MANFNLNVKINGTEQSVSSIGEVEAALRATKQELKEVEIGSEAFEELSRQARILQNELKESFKQATNFDRNLGQLTESVSRLGSSVAASFAIATSAFQIFGGESEELTKAQVKAQQALALAFGATTIATNAAKLSGDLKLVTDRLSLGITGLLTAAVGKETVAKAALAGATGTATIAQRALNVAMSANPIFLVVAAIGALVGAYALFSKESDKATLSVEEQAKRINVLIKELDRQEKIQKEIIQSKKELIRLQAIEDSVGKSEEDRLKIRIQLQEDLNELDAESIKLSIESTKQKIDELTKSTEFQKQFLDSQLDSFAKTGKTSDDYYTKLFAYFKTSKTLTDEQKEALKGYEDSLNSLNRQAEILNKKTVVDEKTSAEEIEKTQKASFEKRKAELERFGKSQEDAIKRLKDIELKAIQDIEKARLSSELDGAEFNRRIEIITRFSELEIEAENEKITEIANAQIKAINDSTIKEEDKKKRILEINEATTAALLKSNELFLNKRTGDIEKETELERRRAEEIALINKTLNDEITFGDQNILNRKDALKVKEREIEIRQLELELSNNRLRVSNNIDTLNTVTQLKLQNNKEQLRIGKDLIEAERVQQLENTKQLYKDKFGQEFFATKEGKEILTKLEENLTAEKNVKIKDLEQKNAQERLEIERELTEEKIAALQKFVDFAANSAQLALNLFSAINDSIKTQRENELIDLKTANNQQLDEVNRRYNSELEIQQQSLEKGLINQEQYNAAVLKLDNDRVATQTGLEQKFRDADLKAKREAFEREKKLRIASTIIAGVQGALQAFAGAFQLGPVAGPIVGGIQAALVAATTAIQVNNIRKQKFDDSGSVQITAPERSGGGPLGGGNNISGESSSAGFTQFNQSLTGTPTGDTSSAQRGGATRVYVLESDITATQNRVSMAESNATIG
jgi:hypothetical protein